MWVTEKADVSNGRNLPGGGLIKNTETKRRRTWNVLMGPTGADSFSPRLEYPRRPPVS